MSLSNHSIFQRGLLCFAVGLYLVVFTLVALNHGLPAGKSMLELARSTSWDNPGDWPAAWSSLKIMAVAFGAVLIILSTSEVLASRRHEVLAGCVASLSLVPGIILWVGFYYLIKALL